MPRLKARRAMPERERGCPGRRDLSMSVVVGGGALEEADLGRFGLAVLCWRGELVCGSFAYF